MGTNWKNRSTYGIILKKKITKMSKLLESIADKEDKVQIDFDNYIALSKAQDYAIQVQHSNIKRVEDFEILEKLEALDERSTRRTNPEEEKPIENRIFR